MKNTITLAAAIAVCTLPAFAGGLSDPIVETPVAYSGLDLSDRNDGLTHRVICSNVQARSGSVGGFFIPNIGYFVMEAAAHLATRDAFVMPAQYHPKVGADVEAYLRSVGLSNFQLVIDDDTERFYEDIEVEVEHPSDVEAMPSYIKTVSIQEPPIVDEEPKTEIVRVLVRTKTTKGEWCK